jgi:hypothetical protein
MNYFNEVIKDILEINLKVKTDNKEERNISFSNFKKPKCPSVDLYSDKTTENPIKQIKINMDCDSFDLYITENDGWIPVGERLPENDYEVLITYWDKENHSDKHVGITSCREVHFGVKIGMIHFNIFLIVMRLLLGCHCQNLIVELTVKTKLLLH